MNNQSFSSTLAEEVMQDDFLSKEICFCENYLKDRSSSFNLAQMKYEHVNISYLNIETVLRNIKQDDKDHSIIKAEKEKSDLKPGFYEGGLKIWECTYDLLKYLVNLKEDFKGKKVLDLGCGSGILGIFSYKCGAEIVHFQDYNAGVLQHFTIPNVFVNGVNELQQSRFFSGDWTSFAENNDDLYDIILTSETIYNCNNYNKLHHVLKEKLGQNGKIFLAGKSYYFGVGGGIAQFHNLVKELNVFSVKQVWEFEMGVKREILELTFN